MTIFTNFHGVRSSTLSNVTCLRKNGLVCIQIPAVESSLNKRIMDGLPLLLLHILEVIRIKILTGYIFLHLVRNIRKRNVAYPSEMIIDHTNYYRSTRKTFEHTETRDDGINDTASRYIQAIGNVKQ